MDRTLKTWSDTFWFGGRIYAEDPDHCEPHHAVNAHSGMFGSVNKCEPDEEGKISLTFYLSNTSEKDNVDPFPDGGLGGHFQVRIPDPVKQATCTVAATFLKLETTRIKAPKSSSECKGMYVGRGRLGSHPTPNDVPQNIEIHWELQGRSYRVVKIQARVDVDAWQKAYEGLMYLSGFM